MLIVFISSMKSLNAFHGVITPYLLTGFSAHDKVSSVPPSTEVLLSGEISQIAHCERRYFTTLCTM